jgi:DEAD/DEAH box helicase domain-containing protein
MQDPLGNFDRIREFYISYLDTAFRIRDTSVADERRALLRQSGTLCTDPLVEAIPRYETYDLHFHELLSTDVDGILRGFSESSRIALVELVLAGLFPSRPSADAAAACSRVGNFKPYRHQMEMLRRGIQEGCPGIVTTGTGSGKTEAFLLPVLAELTREASRWPAPDPSFLQDRWWQDPSTKRPWQKRNRRGDQVIAYSAIPLERRPTRAHPHSGPFEAHRFGERRPAAVRALIVYPMNALVEDQMVRLRRALDSREARAAQDRHLARNRIFFGRYTGNTPVTGHRHHPGLDPLFTLPNEQTVYLPWHPKAAADTGMVGVADLREDELRRRTRSNEKLFEFLVEAEETQREARLHSLDTNARERLGRLLEETSGPVSPAQFLSLATSSGRFDSAALFEQFRRLVGRDPVQDEQTALNRLSLALSDADDAASASGDDAPFLFPSPDGGELLNRWDMQETPPDILITNVSMLSAMLNREVDDQLFTKTRTWLETDPDSYFFVVLDELHLQRGAAGTEVSHLLRLLLDRLGLTRADQRHKVRILASSASLPDAPSIEADRSAQYLWDMFGSFGLGRLSPNEGGREEWRRTLVSGRQVPPKYGRETAPSPIPTGPCRALLEHSLIGPVIDADRPELRLAEVRSPVGDRVLAEAWREIARALGTPAEGDLRGVVGGAIAEVGERVQWACWGMESEEVGEGRYRARPLEVLGSRLVTGFDSERSAKERFEAVRALLFVRGAAEGLGDWLGSSGPSAPSFRVHTFFRSIEGLYAPAVAGLGTDPLLLPRVAPVGRLTIEREPRISVADVPGSRPRSYRLFELLYCESCGELFFGGLKSGPPFPTGYAAELLPHEPLLDGLPDRASSQRFEDQTAEGYAIFWPNEGSPQAGEDDESQVPDSSWKRAVLERRTGGVRQVRDRTGEDAARRDLDLLLGWYYRRPDRRDSHGRDSASRGTHVPYDCPACGTSYRFRNERFRLSPLRNFRAGFGKTTQLLATELVSALRLSNPHDAPKLVTFSDSRQDAARAALDIERNHHQDLRREVLALALRDALVSRRSTAEVEAEIARQERLIGVLMESGFEDQVASPRSRVQELRAELVDARDPVIPLNTVLEAPAAEMLGSAVDVKPYISDLVEIGVHPFDDAGLRRIEASDGNQSHWFDWPELFDDDGASVRWKDGVAASELQKDARKVLVAQVHRSLVDVVFSKTYFAFEEAGLGYPTVERALLTDPSAERLERATALMRVLGDSYRVRPHPYEQNDDDPAPWQRYGEVRKHVKEFADASWGPDARERLEETLGDLGAAGHENGTVRMARLAMRLVTAQDSYFRCQTCGRVHLHRGTGVCTRCFTALPTLETGKVAELHRRNFLSRRIEGRPVGNVRPGFRLHCEELTGQTANPARRQRAFRGIFIPPWEPAENDDTQEDEEVLRQVVNRLDRARAEIDLLAVTTTMEVGIDIGPLQTVLQANMPPQRFNYQQRVGRAGRRGQAFSMALTICRSRSHDLYYFRVPERITGDVPPTPFLAKDMANIAQRFVRKAWLNHVFGLLRDTHRTPDRLFPTDLMSPPDIHGEFLPARCWPACAGIDWRREIGRLLRSTLSERDRLVQVFIDGTVLTAGSVALEPESVERELDSAAIDGVEQGLAHRLAERGGLPMFGMPTRVRNLYLQFSHQDREWQTVDRDLDLAIYEFAPGSTVVIDKQEHQCIGFTPDLAPPRPGSRPQVLSAFDDDAFGRGFRMIECGGCRAWTSLPSAGGPELCAGCGLELDLSRAQECRVPNGFRTDFRPKVKQDEAEGGTRHRSIQAEGAALRFESMTCPLRRVDGQLNVAFESTARTYRLNRGPKLDAPLNGQAFQLQRGRQDGYPWRTVTMPSQVVADSFEANIRGFVGEGAEPALWLAAPKTTDGLYLAPTCNPVGLALHRLPARSDVPTPVSERWLGVRAAAISATYLVASRAALDLDIDPEEFDVLEPRVYGHGLELPMLQITDHLINGAGFCRHLVQASDGQSNIAALIASMLEDSKEFPLSELQKERHADCDTACYRCLLRYGNQSFHGLLDWPLGMVYLRAIVDPRFRCGLDGRFEDTPGLSVWPGVALRLASEMADRFHGETTSFGSVPAFRIRIGRELTPWILVAHPLWEWDEATGPAVDGVLASAYELAIAGGDAPLCWDTFNLSRRQVLVRERIRATLSH